MEAPMERASEQLPQMPASSFCVIASCFPPSTIAIFEHFDAASNNKTTDTSCVGRLMTINYKKGLNLLLRIPTNDIASLWDYSDYRKIPCRRRNRARIVPASRRILRLFKNFR